MSRSILDYFSKERCKVDLPDPRSAKYSPLQLLQLILKSLELKSTGEKEARQGKSRGKSSSSPE